MTGKSLQDPPDFGRTRHEQREPRPSRRVAKVIDPYQGPSYALTKDERLARHDEPRVDIVICVRDALDHVQRCLASVVPTLRPHHRVILIDDNSGPATANWLDEFAARHAHMVVVRNETRLGYTKAANIGLRASNADFVILLNSDTIVTGDWIAKLCDAAFAATHTGIVGPLSNAASSQSIPNHLGDARQTAVNDIPEHISIEDLDRWCEEWTVASILPAVPLIHGFCFGIKREVIGRIGLFDEERFPSGYGEENDYCFRAADAGFDLRVATQTYVFHAKSKSYAVDERIRLMAAGNTALEEKYGAERVGRAVRTMSSDPILQIFRDNAKKRYRSRRLHSRLFASVRRLAKLKQQLGLFRTAL